MRMLTLMPKILNMSLTASIVIILVLAARLLLKRAPKVFSYALWAVVLFRLVCPVSLSSQFSLMGLFRAPASKAIDSAYSSITYIPTDIVSPESPKVETVPDISETINNGLPHDEAQITADPPVHPMAVATALWLFGIAGMLVYSAVSLIRLRRRLVGAVRLRGNIYLADHIVTPFVIGIFRPKIYLPSTLRDDEQSYVIYHEQTHIRRLDHIVKMLAFIALAVHWFNPLVWVAFVFAVKDMEMSCDERVLKQMGAEIKTAYSVSLLLMAAGRRPINGGPLAFGGGNIKRRIKNIMYFKKPAAWVIAISVLLVFALSVGFAVNSAVDVSDPDGYEALVKGEDGLWRFDECFGDSGTGEQEESLVTEADPEKSVFNTSWNNIIANSAAGLLAEESEVWQKKLQEDIPGVHAYTVGGLYFNDLDANGKSDLMVLLHTAEGLSLDAYIGVYMNDDLIYMMPFEGMFTAFGFMQYPFSGDIDSDGYPEIVYNIFTGGVGGAGSSVKGVLKYKNHTLVPMLLPGEKSVVFTEYNDVGYPVKVLFGSGENAYKAVCESLGQTVYFYAQNALDENGTRFRPFISENEEVGANARGYSAFSIVNRNGRDRLLAEEYLYGEAGISHNVGYATFIIEWDLSGEPQVSEFGVSDKSLRSTTDLAEPNEPIELIARADVNQDGKEESIYLDKSTMETAYSVDLIVTDSGGNEIWREALNTSHPGWKQIFLTELDGRQYILRYTPYMGQGYCTYVYSLFTPMAGEKEQEHQTKTLEFDVNGTIELDTQKMIAFADEINALLGKSRLLISSDEGVWRFGLSSAEPFYEQFSWLDQNSALYADGDSLETKLNKYNNWAVNNRRLSDLLFDTAYKIVSTDKFSDIEIRDAMYCVVDKFKDFKGCTLTKLYYDEQKSNNEIDIYMKYGHGLSNGVDKDNVIILYSDFDVDSSGGDSSLNPNSTHVDWLWILIRDSKEDNWRVDDWGY